MGKRKKRTLMGLDQEIVQLERDFVRQLAAYEERRKQGQEGRSAGELSALLGNYVDNMRMLLKQLSKDFRKRSSLEREQEALGKVGAVASQRAEEVKR